MTTTITPANTLETLKKYILVDGFPIVFDLEKSKGAHFFNAYDGKTYLDCFSFFASLPIGFNHPGLSDSTYPTSTPLSMRSLSIRLQTLRVDRRLNTISLSMAGHSPLKTLSRSRLTGRSAKIWRQGAGKRGRKSFTSKTPFTVARATR
jgi:hypothetical protein